MPQNTLLAAIKNELQDTFSISVPLISSQLVYSSSWFISTIMVAQLGKDALASSVLVNMVWYTITVFFFGILNGVSVLVSHQYGAKNYKAISDIMGQAFIFGAIILVVIICSFSVMSYFLHWSSQPPHVLALSRVYLHSLLWMMPGLIMLIIMEQFLAGINRAKIVLRISLLVVPIEIPIIYMLVFGKFGLPTCGIAGIGYGYAITYTITSIGMAYMLLRFKHYQIFDIFASINKINPTQLLELIKVGTPMGFMHLIEISTFMVTTFWIAQFGTTMLAAHQLVMQYLGFAITIVFGMSQGITVRVGHCIGANNLSAVKLASYVGMYANLFLILLIAILFYCIPTVFLSIDINVHQLKNLELVHDASSLLAICGVLLIFDNFRINGFGALRGLKETKFPMYASLVSFWLIGLSSAYLLAFHFQLDGLGIWWGLTFGIICGAVIVHLKVRSMLKKLEYSL